MQGRRGGPIYSANKLGIDAVKESLNTIGIDTGKTCSFCYDDLRNGEPIEAIFCGHTYHTACLETL